MLLSLSEEELISIEVNGLSASWPDRTPESLLALVDEVRRVCTVESLVAPGAPAGRIRRRETPRKRAQIDAFVQLVQPLIGGARRIVDVGSGHGHLTRELADRIDGPVVGFERNEALAARARALPSKGAPSFVVTDVLRDGLQLSKGDCVVALHACGELGDAIVVRAAEIGVSVALVACCLQKQRANWRSPLCDAGTLGASLDLPKGLLGLSNLTMGDEGVESSRASNVAARERRLALHHLLSKSEGALPFGAEIDGLNRRASHGDLSSLVARAFLLRELPAPSPLAIEASANWARCQHARARRLSVPRALLARAIEVFVLLDRSLYLQERGLQVKFGALFPTAVSARNLALTGVA